MSPVSGSDRLMIAADSGPPSPHPPPPTPDSGLGVEAAAGWAGVSGSRVGAGNRALLMERAVIARD